MARFRLRYMDHRGKARITTLQADSEAEANSKAQGLGVKLISVVKLDNSRHPHRKKRTSASCLHEYTSLFAMLLSSSLSARDALAVVMEVAERNDVKILARKIAMCIDKGARYSEAIEEEISDLPPVYRGLVKIGERTGELGTAYVRMASFLDEQKRIRDAFSGALVYPAIVLSVVIVGMIGLSVYALPKLLAVFSELGGDAKDRLLRSLGQVQGASYALAIITLLAFLGAVFVSIMKKKDREFALKVDKALLKIPLVGDIAHSRAMLDFTFSMEALTHGGIALDEALLESGSACGNAFIAQGVASVRTEVRKGSALSVAIRSSGAFKPYVSQWVAVGERTGKVFEVFSQLRGYYQSQTERRSKAFVQLIEPALTVLLGIGIIALVVTFVIPLFQAMGSLF